MSTVTVQVSGLSHVPEFLAKVLVDEKAVVEDALTKLTKPDLLLL